MLGYPNNLFMKTFLGTEKCPDNLGLTVKQFSKDAETPSEVYNNTDEKTTTHTFTG